MRPNPLDDFLSQWFPSNPTPDYGARWVEELGAGEVNMTDIAAREGIDVGEVLAEVRRHMRSERELEQRTEARVGEERLQCARRRRRNGTLLAERR